MPLLRRILSLPDGGCEFTPVRTSPIIEYNERTTAQTCHLRLRRRPFDSREANRAYYNHLLAKFACPPMDEAELDYVHSHNVTDSVATFSVAMSGSNGRLSTSIHRTGLSPFLQYMIMDPDLPEFLSRIKPCYNTAISTNRTTTMPLLLDRFHLRPWFDQVVTALNTPRPSPAPDALKMIMKNFALDAAESIFIGDSEVDRLHAESVGMRLIAFKIPRSRLISMSMISCPFWSSNHLYGRRENIDIVY